MAARWPRRFLAPGASTGTVDLGQISGQHTLGLQGEGEVGGCNSGTLGNWGGSATVTVGVSVPGGSPAAVPGPGMVATTLAFLLGAFAFFLRRRARR
jgi:hypothetical protein